MIIARWDPPGRARNINATSDPEGEARPPERPPRDRPRIFYCPLPRPPDLISRNIKEIYILLQYGIKTHSPITLPQKNLFPPSPRDALPSVPRLRYRAGAPGTLALDRRSRRGAGIWRSMCFEIG
ncbi:gigantea [Musa troglodytarum]|uniref:Gigantea n=1 Tax=Musa troglodytarum TaxID=320322 RepID=A0A9E7GTQ2_9LILI|nr:gigantea [Musa troglodytarum]